LADEILAAVRACSPSESPVSASIGISLSPEHATSASVLVRLADLAMYQSKSHSGDCRVFYDPGMKVDFGSAKVAGTIRSALKHRNCVLWYQPIVDCAGRVVRMEALLRINDPQLGLIAPGSFIAVAEETGLIHALGSWVRYMNGVVERVMIDNLPPELLDRPSIFDVLKQQLGLKLEAQKGPVEYYVIDHVEESAGN
jgi:predicted signal transduction protein with EAL and GGDEF domain